MKKLPKHHYIPVFYLKQWIASDGRMIEFSRPYLDEVRCRRIYPDATGYVRGLYRLPGVSDEAAEIMETKFFKTVDDWASYAHQKILRKQMADWNAKMRSAWTRFIIAVLVRSPRHIAETKTMMLNGLPEEWEKLRGKWFAEHPEDEPDEYDPITAERLSLLAIQRFINDTEIGDFINNMYWSVIDVSKSKYRFLTSDRPIIMSDGLGYETSNLSIPVNPAMIFVATNNIKTQDTIKAMPAKDIVHNANKQIVRNAVKYVWAQDHSQEALVSQMSRDADPGFSLLKPYLEPKRKLVPAARKMQSRAK